MSPDFPYTRLPGTLRGFVRKASLWEGSDHVLSVAGNRFVESYRRFYYRDIEAIIVQKCARTGSLGAWILSCFLLLLACNWLSHGRWMAVALPAAIVLLLLVTYRAIVSFRFSCRCVIQTAVSREELPALLRTWNVPPALERLRARIAEAQGALPAEIESHWQEHLARRENSSPTQPDTSDSAEPPPVFGLPAKRFATPYAFAVNLALCAFFLCLVDATVSFYFIDGPSPALSTFSMRLFNVLLTLGQGGTIVFSLLRVHKIRALRSLRNLLLAALCFTGLEVWLGILLGSLFSVQRGVSTIRIDSLAVWQALQKFDATVALLLGIGGLLLVLLNWQTFRRGGLSTT